MNNVPALPPGPPGPTIPEPARSVWGPFVGRITKLLVRPAAFWEEIRDVPLTVGELVWPHVTVLVGARALAALVGRLLRGASVLGALSTFFSSVVSWFALVWVFAILVLTIAAARGARLSAQDAFKYAAFGVAPLFLVGLLALIPLPLIAPIAELLAMPYTFYVLSLGVVPLLGVPQARAPAAVGILLGTLLVLWSVMPTLIPILVDRLVR